MQKPEKECIKESYCIELEVKDSWQIPAVYKVYKVASDIQVNEGDFIKECSEEEYENILATIYEMKIEEWEKNYELSKEASRSVEDEFSWKLVIIYGDNKKIIKRGMNLYPEAFNALEELMIDITEENI